MASYETVIRVARPIDETFAFISSFDNAARWDPRTYESTIVTDGPIGVGTVCEPGNDMKTMYGMLAGTACVWFTADRISSVDEVKTKEE